MTLGEAMATREGPGEDSEITSSKIITNLTTGMSGTIVMETTKPGVRTHQRSQSRRISSL